MSDTCPKCGTAATYQLGENNFMCKCTYEFEIGEQSDGMAYTDLSKPIRLSPRDWERLNEALEGEQK